MPATLDARGLKCPLPVLRASKILADLPQGETLIVTATDPGTMPDMRGWAAADVRVAVESQAEAIDDQGRTIYVHTLRRR